MSHKDVLEIHQELIFADGIVSLSRYLYVLYKQDLPDKKLFFVPWRFGQRKMGLLCRVARFFLTQ
jgi:hypothetical protein